MRKPNKLWVVLTVLLVVAFAFPAFALADAPGSGDSPADKAPAPIRLKSGEFNPGKGETPNVPPGLAVSDEAISRKGYGYYLVQFTGPVQEAWKAELESLGATLLEYIPEYAYKVRLHPGQVQHLSRLPEVAYVGKFEPAFKESPDLQRDQPGLYSLRPERGADVPTLAAELAASGVEVLRAEPGELLIAAAPGQLDAAAGILDVAWIENFQMIEKHNESGAGQIMGANSAYANGYDGSTQTVAVADTGLGGGTAAAAHADIPASRIASIFNWRGVDDTCWTLTDDGAVDVDSGHGTHTSLSVVGDGDLNGTGKGTAPAARLVFQAVENWALMKGTCALYYPSGYYLTGLPADLRSLFQQAYDAGARIHSNSWGSAAAGAYTANSAYADDFMWSHPDMLITFSAGNEGVDANSDGLIDSGSLGAPATAKNVLSVGASENSRLDGFPCDPSLTYNSCAFQGGKNLIFTYGSGWPQDYPVNPISSDPSAGNAQQMAAFSSRGPVDDGRIKPDVVAPGSWVLSGYSDLYQQGYDPSPNPKNNAFQYDGYGYPYSQGYKYMSGTSMSNPLVAGGAAVVRDYYQKAHNLPASAALVKATLINSAVDLLDENNDGVNDNDFPIPNNHEGWGLVNLANATDGTAQFVDQATGLTTASSSGYNFTVNTAGYPFKASLVWSDFASTETAAVNLVNDLDLMVTAPDGTVYYGNAFSDGWSIAGGSRDRRNNVENVYLPSAQVGTWTVMVTGYNIPQGPQPFALVVDGALGPAGPTPTPAPTAAVPPTPVPTMTPTPTPAPIQASTGLLNPTANKAVTKASGDNNGFEANPTYAYLSDNLYAADMNSGSSTSTSCSNNKKDRHIFYNYNFNLPAGSAVKGLEVRLEGKADSASSAPQFCVELSWDGGVTWSIPKVTGPLSTTDTLYLLGGSGDLWNRTWTGSELSNAAFRLRITPVSSATARDFYLDWVGVNVTYAK